MHTEMDQYALINEISALQKSVVVRLQLAYN